MKEPAGPIRVVIADDQELVRAGFRALLDAPPPEPPLPETLPPEPPLPPIPPPPSIMHSVQPSSGVSLPS